MVGLRLNCYVDPTVELDIDSETLLSFTSNVSETRYLGWIGPGLRLGLRRARLVCRIKFENLDKRKKGRREEGS